MTLIRNLSVYAIPAIFLIILFLGVYKEIKVFDVFVEGAKEGVSTVVKIVPSLVGLMVAIGVFRVSGALDLIIYVFRPVAYILSIPYEVLPLAFLRPVSGSASLALVLDIMKVHGPDSYIGRLASTMMGSTETIFYTLAVYFGAVGIKNIRYTLLGALAADLAGIFGAVWICNFIFNS